MHRRPVLVAFVFAITFVLVCPFPIDPAPHATAAQSATPGVASAVPASGDFAGLVDIGGRSLYLECHGTGSPTVMLVAGYRASGPLLERRSAPPGRAADHGAARRGGDHPRLCLRPPWDLRQHRRGRRRQPQ